MIRSISRQRSRPRRNKSFLAQEQCGAEKFGGHPFRCPRDRCFNRERARWVPRFARSEKTIEKPLSGISPMNTSPVETATAAVAPSLADIATRKIFENEKIAV